MWKQSAEPHLENGASAGLAQWYWTVGSLSCRVARQWPPCGTGISCLSELVPETCIPLRRLEGVWDRQTLHFSFEVKLLGNDVLQSSVSVAVWWAPQANCLMNLISGLQNWCSLWPWGSCAPVSLMAKSQETVMKAWHYAAVACFLKPLPRDGAVAVELPSNWGNQKAQSSTLSLHILQKRIGVWGCFDTASSSNSAFKPEHLRCYVSCSAQQRMALSWVPFYTGLSSNPEVHFKPLFCFQEYKKLVSKEKMKPWYTDISVCVATELPLSLLHSPGGVGITYLADRWRCFVRAADHAGGRAEVTVLLPWSLIPSMACDQLQCWWIFALSQDPFPCKWLWMCLVVLFSA